jgi:hypothetical protein
MTSSRWSLHKDTNPLRTEPSQKEEVKLSLFADDMILYLRDPKNSTKKTVRNHKLFQQSSRYNINIQKSLGFLHTNNTQTEKEIRETIPFTIASKKPKVPWHKFNERNQRPF